MLFAVFFAFWRFMQILTLIPTMGMLAYFVHAFVERNQLTPDLYLVMFIVSTIALAWAIYTLFSYHRSSANALAVAVVDLGFVGAFIAAVWYMRSVANADCTRVVIGQDSWTIAGSAGSLTVNGASVDISTDKTCAMLKACFAFGIMNCIMFFFTSVLAWWHGDRLSSRRDSGRRSSKNTYYTRETHVHRHGHRSRSRSHGGSRRSSHHSHRRAYV
ncbi:uncharacterized protein B0I36DRAFT_335997 [Microdochium trichocladiopsis]|uniref:MARVEL domain-containing protein n=1 Tax=Microdochium trichocladiopsis TaxID=1682393 RepID=A0A9P8XV46_9PEZI|nr:uncharacterized protein B0I36DRAFT_335997 [Microdochium trichocladiopsis]KAH7018461.1 hypothetical protein B0I36DRAFT_335997 [Microdochium trichocladiopsis]